MPWKVQRRKGKYLVIREGGKVVGTHDTEAQAERHRRALYASEYWLRKARARMFASRSEAGRYAAHIRWANARGEQPMSVEDWRASSMAPVEDDAIGIAETEAGRMFQSLMSPTIDPETGETTSGNTVVPILEVRYSDAFGDVATTQEWWAKRYDADPALYSGGELTRENFVGQMVTSEWDAYHNMLYQVTPPLRAVDLGQPHLYDELFVQSLGNPWVSQSGRTIANPPQEGYFDPEGKPLLSALDIRRDIAIRSDNSPPNPDGLRVEDIIRWERPSLNNGAGFSYADSLGFFASKRAGYGEPFPKPDYSWVERGDGKASDATLDKAAGHILKKVYEAEPAQPQLWRGETLRAEYESPVFKAGDTFKLGLAGFSGSPAIAADYARQGTSGVQAATRQTPRVYYLEPGAKGVKMPVNDSRFPHDHEVLTSGTFRVKSVETVRVSTQPRRSILALQEKRLNQALSSGEITSREHGHIKAQLDYEIRTLPKYTEYEVVSVSQETLP